MQKAIVPAGLGFSSLLFSSQRNTFLFSFSFTMINHVNAAAVAPESWFSDRYNFYQVPLGIPAIHPHKTDQLRPSFRFRIGGRPRPCVCVCACLCACLQVIPYLRTAPAECINRLTNIMAGREYHARGQTQSTAQHDAHPMFLWRPIMSPISYPMTLVDEDGVPPAGCPAHTDL